MPAYGQCTNTSELRPHLLSNSSKALVSLDLLLSLAASIPAKGLLGMRMHKNGMPNRLDQAVNRYTILFSKL